MIWKIVKILILLFIVISVFDINGYRDAIDAVNERYKKLIPKQYIHIAVLVSVSIVFVGLFLYLSKNLNDGLKEHIQHMLTSRNILNFDFSPNVFILKHKLDDNYNSESILASFIPCAIIIYLYNNKKFITFYNKLFGFGREDAKWLMIVLTLFYISNISKVYDFASDNLQNYLWWQEASRNILNVEYFIH